MNYEQNLLAISHLGSILVPIDGTQGDGFITSKIICRMSNNQFTKHIKKFLVKDSSHISVGSYFLYIFKSFYNNKFS